MSDLDWSRSLTDPNEHASVLEQMEREEALRRTSLLAAPEQTQDADGNWEHTECVDCGEDIEPARLNLGKVRCFRCQSALEDRRKQYGSRH